MERLPVNKEETDVRSFYNLDAAEYDKRWQSPGGRYTSAVQIDIVSEICSQWSEYNVLEVGCGTGRFTTVLGSSCRELTVVDLAESMLRTTKHRIEQHNLQKRVHRFVNASIYDLPFEATYFDAAVAINVFSHLDQPFEALRAIGRVQRRNGRLLLTFPNSHSYYFLPALVVNQRGKSLERQVFSHWYKPSDMIDMIREAGYSVLQTIGNVHIPSFVDLPIIRDGLQVLDQQSRDSRLKRFAPIWFVECRKGASYDPAGPFN